MSDDPLLTALLADAAHHDWMRARSQSYQVETDTTNEDARRWLRAVQQRQVGARILLSTETRWDVEDDYE